MKYYFSFLGLLILHGGAVVQAAGFDATVLWARKVELGMPVSGVVAGVSVQPGQEVKKGTVMVELDQTPFAAGVERAEAAVVRTGSNRKQAKRDYEQAQELYERTVLSTVSLEDAEEKFRQARAAYKKASADLTLARYELERSRIRAPFDAWVLARHVEPGQTVVSRWQSQPLVVLAARGEYIARAWLEESGIKGIQVNQKALVTVMGRTVNGKVRTVGLEPLERPNSDDLRYQVDIYFTVDGPALRAGQHAKIEFD